jgi:hypothetical protein
MPNARVCSLAAVVLLFLLAVPGAGAWTWPVRGPVLAPFSFDPSHPYAGGQHRGVDVGAAAGDTVVAPAAGVVTFAGTVPSSGTTVSILTGDALSVTLTHLGSVTVAKGVSVGEGSAVGTVGPTGTPELDVPYVHLGVRTAADDNGYLDPLSFLAPAAPSAPAAPPAPQPTPPAAEPAPAPPAAASPPAADPAPPVVVPSAAAAPAPPVREPAPAVEAPPPVPAAPAVVPGPAAAPVGPVAAPADPAEPPFDPAGPTPAPRAEVEPVAPAAVAVRAAGGDSLARAVAPLFVDSPPLEARVEAGSPRAAHSPRGGMPSVRRRVDRSASIGSARVVPPPAATSQRRHRRSPFPLVVLAAAALAASLGGIRMISSPSARSEGASTVREDPRRTGVAVRQRPASHRPRGGLRRAGGRLRALPPAEGRRRADGQRHRRARHAGDGGRGQERRVAA